MSGPAERFGGVLASLGSLREAGVLGLERPDRAARSIAALAKFGPSAAAALESWAVRNPTGIAVVDDAGIHTWRELADRADGLARALHSRGVKAGDRVGVLIRDHADFVATVGAISRIGADTILLNTSFAAPQVAGVVERESISALIHDGEYSQAASLAKVPGPCVVAWPEGAPEGCETIDDLVRSAPAAEAPAPRSPGRTVILTSGTTGTPKGANRSGPPSLLDAATLLERIPLKAGRVTVIGAPLFHSWGFAHLSLASALGSTIVLRRRFNPAQVVADANRYHADTIALVPVMLQRMLDLDPAEGTLAKGAVRIIALSGSALSAELAVRATERYGHVLYNLYGSTEVAWATIAGPDDIAAAPGTAGRPPRGTLLRLFDDEGNEVEQGERGRIFVGNGLMFEGYTGGGGKEVIDGLMSTGDVGRLDAAGRLFVEGRDDDMIVSGGENVFPEEVEECLAMHPGVREAAVVGIPDEEFGQRLRAAVVREPGSEVDSDALAEHVRAHLARYKVPREIIFLDELPRNATGKILRRRIAE